MFPTSIPDAKLTRITMYAASESTNKRSIADRFHLMSCAASVVTSAVCPERLPSEPRTDRLIT